MDNMENTVSTEEVVKPYTLRRLKDKDLWPVLDIIGKVFPEDLSAVFLSIATRQQTIEEAGSMVIVKLIRAAIRNMNTVREDVYAFLSDVSGVPVNEIEEMEFGTTPMMLWDIVKNEKNASFFTAVSKLS